MLNVCNWKTNCFNTSVSFDIQKRADGRTFKSIGNISATRDSCDQPFNFTDNSPFSGTNYYRLKKTEIDGQVSYSVLIAIINKESGFEIVGLMPNVVRSNAVLNVTAAKITTMQIMVSDIQGRIMQQQTIKIAAG